MLSIQLLDAFGGVVFHLKGGLCAVFLTYLKGDMSACDAVDGASYRHLGAKMVAVVEVTIKRGPDHDRDYYSWTGHCQVCFPGSRC